MAKPFTGDRRGAVFVIFALLLPVVLTGILGLLSLSGFASARADLQAASNAAANAVLADLNATLQISATPDAIVTDVNKQQRAEAIVQSLLGSRSDLRALSTLVTTDSETITVTVAAEITNVTADVFWVPYIPASAKTTVSWSRADQLQIALAIDSGTSVTSSPLVQIRMPLLKLGLVAAINFLSVMPSYPDVAISVVPFTAQVATDPALVLAQDSGASWTFDDALNAQFADSADWLLNWIVTPAHAGVTACFNEPIVPKNVDGSAFGGVSRPLQNSCETSLQPIRSLARISKPRLNGQIVATESINSPAKQARDAMINTINAVSPAGCRNLAMGVTWSLAQLPTDQNPKVIFLVANGQNSKGPKGRTSDCPGGGGLPPRSVAAQLDQDFVSACELVRDPMRNNGRRLDLLVLQAVDGNPVALKSCASTTDKVTNYFSTSSVSALVTLIDSARDRLVKIAQRQQQNNQNKR